MSDQFLIFTHGRDDQLFVTSALSLTSRVASLLYVLSSVPANSCLYGVSSYNIHRLQRVQNCLTLVVKPTHSATASRSLLASLHWLPIRQRVTFKLAGLVYRNLHDTSPPYLSSLLHAYTLARSSSAHLLVEPRLRTTLASRGFRSAGPRIWNSLPHDITLAPSFSSFRSKLKTYFFTLTPH